MGAQYESEVVYHSLHEDLGKQGVIFVDTDTGLREYPELYREYFGTVIPPQDNKFAALNTAVWSGGSVRLSAEGRQGGCASPGLLPNQRREDGPVRADAHHRRRRAAGPLRRGLHGADTPPTRSTRRDRDHRASKGARVTLHYHPELVAHNVYNLVTNERWRYEGATMEWVDANLGSKAHDEVPSRYLMEPGAQGEMLSMAFAGHGQHQDAGAKVVHAAPNTSSRSSPSPSARRRPRLLPRPGEGSQGRDGSKSTVVCDALSSTIIAVGYLSLHRDRRTERAASATRPRVSKVSDEQIFYLMSRGLSEAEAATMIVSGFIEPMVKELPMEYAVEMNRLIQLQMEGAVG